jgi:hypothetical protein
MQRINQYEFYQLGLAIHPLEDIKDDASLEDVLFPLWSAQSALQKLLNDKLIPLRVCLPAARTLLDAISAVIAQILKPGDLEHGLKSARSSRITTSLQTFETVFAAELLQLDTYFVSQKGIYSTRDLIEHADRILPQDILSELPDAARKDIRDAGRCLAFDLPTAAAFHILRALETVILKYYSIVTNHEVKMKTRNWGAYIKMLEKTKADKKIVALLDQIREMHRNPIMHPEVTLSMNEAECLFAIAQSAILSITADIEKHKQLELADA